MKVALLIIGDEILNGSTLDTNSHFAAGLLREHNYQVISKITVGDNHGEIITALATLFSKADLVISSGGLGPTKDDVTKEAISSYFNTPLIFNEEIYENLRQRYEKRGMDINKLNRTQALVPEIATVIQNSVGTAPVLWIEQGDKVLVTLPGVPSELRFLLENVVLERIKQKFPAGVIVQKAIKIVGIPESSLALKIAPAEEAIEAANDEDEFYKLAYLPEMGTLKLQITARGTDEKRLEHQVEAFKEQIHELAGEYIFGYDQDVFAKHIGQILKDRDATVSTAESCTGGYLAHQITSVTGSADYFMGGIISYDNDVKIKELGVKQETLDEVGAVSQEVCIQMVEGSLEKFGTTYAIATTGIAGPTGAGEGKPIGTVWIGVGTKYNIITKKYQFDRNRLENIHLFTITALDMLRRLVLGYRL